MTIINYKRLTDLRWVNMFEVNYIDKKGNIRTWEVASRKNEPTCIRGNNNRPDAVVIVPFHQHKKKLVITKEYRVAIDGFEYGFPAGIVDEGESIKMASYRELKEETGLEMTGILKKSPPIYSSAGMTDESVSIVYAECEGDPSNKFNEGTESIEVLFISPKDGLMLLKDTELKFDAKAWLILSNYAKNNWPCH